MAGFVLRWQSFVFVEETRPTELIWSHLLSGVSKKISGDVLVVVAHL